MTDEAYRRLPEEKCRAKHRFKSAQHQSIRSGRDIFYYRCGVCSKWHLTSKDPKERDLRALSYARHQ